MPGALELSRVARDHIRINRHYCRRGNARARGTTSGKQNLLRGHLFWRETFFGSVRLAQKRGNCVNAREQAWWQFLIGVFVADYLLFIIQYFCHIIQLFWLTVQVQDRRPGPGASHLELVTFIDHDYLINVSSY